MIDFISPMLASPYTKLEFVSGAWVAEEKFDGHRIVVAVGAASRDLFGGRSVMAWSREAKVRLLPTHIRVALEALPDGVYDGELIVPGQRSYGVTELVHTEKLVYVMFDVMFVAGSDITHWPYHFRRQALELAVGAQVEQVNSSFKKPLHLSQVTPIYDKTQIMEMANGTWTKGGEGLILKKINSSYHRGKRTKDWIKVKALESHVLTLIGYRPGKLGPHSTLVLHDKEQNETTVKWKNLAMLKLLDADPKSFLGRKVRIECQERLPDGGYRHPRFDRWEDQ